MTPDRIELVQSSFSKLTPISEQAAVMSCDRPFEVALKVKSLFPSDITEARQAAEEEDPA